jgi:N-carbamoyl-L-amino-acid hydrolase
MSLAALTPPACSEMNGIAARLFSEIAALSADAEGISRPAFSQIETDILRYLHDFAGSEGLSACWDAGGNVVFSLPEHAGAGRHVLVGSHVDSVPRGGNFDGLAGVLCGLICLLKARRDGSSFSRPVKVIAMRGEESAWFGPCYIGSKALLGVLSQHELSARHRGDGRTLDEHMAAVGIDMPPVRSGRPLIDDAEILAYIEVHIEQGPVLVESQLPIAVVSGIRGNFRYGKIACHGEAGHSGAVPLAYRHDPVLAMAELLNVLDDAWRNFVAEGHDLVVTSGMVSTDQQKHALSRIPDSVEFSLDIRSQDAGILHAMQELVLAHAERIGRERSVTFDLGKPLWTDPALCSEPVITALAHASEAIGEKPFLMPSGGGHDAAVFAGAGVPCGMLFIRNRNGSHNPREAMDIEDFEIATNALYHFLSKGSPASVRNEASQQAAKETTAMFTRITDVIRSKGNAAHAYRAASAAAEEAAIAEPERSAGFFMLAIAAQEVADAFYGNPVAGNIFDEQLSRFEGYTSSLDKAFETADAQARLDALSALASDLVKHSVET